MKGNMLTSRKLKIDFIITPKILSMEIVKKLLPHVIAVLVFIIISFSYFNPLLDGKSIRQGDIMQFIGMSKEIVDFREKTGTEPLWTNSMFGGMPAYQISVVYHHNVAKNINNIMTLHLPVPAVYLFLALVGFYILMLVLGANSWIAVAGAIAFSFSSYFFIIESAGHNSKTHAMTFIAPMIAGVILTFRGRYLLGAAIFVLYLALQLNANHLQITYYTAITILIFAIVEFIYALREKRLLRFSKAVVVLAAMSVIAVFTNITNMLLTYEYGKESTRGKSELTSNAEDKTSGLDKSYILDNYSYGVAETFDLFIPNFRGGASASNVGENSETYRWLESNYGRQAAETYSKHMPTYWGSQLSTAGPVYLGAVVVFLFVLGLFLIKGPFKWWVVTATVLAVFLAWGKNMEWFSTLFINYFPGYNKFRTVSMILVIVMFTVPLLGMMGFIKILKNEIEKKEILNALKYSLYIVGGFALLFSLIPGIAGNFEYFNDENHRLPEGLLTAIISDRSAMLRMDAFRSLVFVLLTAGLIWLVVKEKIKPVWASIVLALLFIVDLGAVGKRYLSEENFVTKRESKQPYAPSEADLLIMEDKDPNFRVINLTVDPFNDASTSYFHKSIGGYHGAKLKRFQELIEHQISKQNMQVLNMLNTKYFIVPDQEQKPVARPNPDALGNAWFVDTVKIADNADKEMEALNTLHPKTSVVVDKRFQNLISKTLFTVDSTSQIKLESYAPNYLVYQSRSATEGLAVFSEIYYDKGWNAYLDGKLVPYFRANYVLRGMSIPAGNHKIEFKFEPKLYTAGERISMISSILLVIVVLGGFGFEIFQYLKTQKAS